MRELKDINADIDKLNGEKRIIDDKLHELFIERGKRVQYDFEQKHGLKRGDLVELKNGKRLYYDFVRPFGETLPLVYCRKPKKIVGHQELP